MKKVILLIILFFTLSGCSDDPPVLPPVFGNNPATINYIRSLNSDIKEVAISPFLASKACRGTFRIYVGYSRETLWGSKTDWLQAATAFYYLSEDMFGHYGGKIYKLVMACTAPGKDRFGNKTTEKWARLTVIGVDAARIKWKNVDWLQYTQSFVKLESSDLEAQQWLADFRGQYGISTY